MLKLKNNILTERLYQNEAIFSISNFVKDLLRGILKNDLNKVFQNAALLNMATGSGKTFTIGKALNNIIKLRNRFNGIKNKEEFQKLNIVVLTHRIDLVNQFRDDLVYGRDDKASILTNEILNSLHISTYHSKADKDDNLLDNEEDDLGEGKNKDNIIFSTYQTAGLKKIVDKLDYVDIILIDESHNVKLNSEYEKVVKELSLKTRTGTEALILPVTATPNNQTRRLFGEEIFDYGLEKYLNSKYSPNVEYNLVTNSNADIELIERLSSIVEESKHTEYIKLKKELIKEAEELFSEIMSSFVDNDALVGDLFDRAGKKGEFEETIIFCDSIKSADELAAIMNKKRGIDGYALAFHSKNDSNDAINKLRDKNDPCKVILSIGKLNEGIDLPKVKNVVFWRGTDSETIFFQQFGRGLRGDELVRYFDYVGGIKNFAWINKIFVKYNKIADVRISEGGSGEGGKKKFSLLGGNMGTSHHNIDLVDVGLDILNQKNKFNINKKEVINYFKTIKLGKDESYNYLFSFNQNDIKEIIFKGCKIVKLVGLTGYRNDKYYVEGPLGFKKWINWLFDKEEENFNKETVVNYFQNIKKTNDESYYYLIGLNGKEIKNIRFNGKSIVGLVGVTGYTKQFENSPLSFRKWINWLFDKEGENIDKETITHYLKNIKKSKESSYDFLMGLKHYDLLKIEFKGIKLIKLMTITGFDKSNEDTKSGIKIFKKWINWLFDKEEENINKESVVNYLKNIKKSEKESYNYLIELKTRDYKKIIFMGLGLTSIVKHTGYESNEMDIYSSGGFKKWINWLFNKEGENINKESVINYFKNIKKSEEESYIYFIGLKVLEISKIEFKGNKISNLTKISGWKNTNNSSLYKINGFKEWINWLFEKKIPNKQD